MDALMNYGCFDQNRQNLISIKCFFFGLFWLYSVSILLSDLLSSSRFLFGVNRGFFAVSIMAACNLATTTAASHVGRKVSHAGKKGKQNLRIRLDLD